MTSSAEVKAYKLYADADSVSKQDGNTAFAAGKDINAEIYLVMGTDVNTSAYANGLPEGSLFRSDILHVETLSKLDKLLLDLEVTGTGNNANLGVYKYSERIGKWVYIGGSFDEARSMMSEYAIGSGKYAVIENPKMSESVFDDIGGSWAKLYISSLAYIGFINGYSEADGLHFKPENEITRGELVKILAAANGTAIGTTDVSMFADADEIDDWVKPYAAAAYNAGWFKGSMTSRGIEAKLSERVTRQDAMTLVYRVFFENETSDGHLAFSDSSKVSEYAADAVSYLTEQGIVSGFENGSLKPLDFLLREQIAKILWVSIIK